MRITRVKMLTMALCLCAITAAATDADAWINWVSWGFTYGDEPGDQCSSMHWMCHDYCGGGSYDSYCEYTYPPEDSMDGYCYCA